MVAMKVICILLSVVKHKATIEAWSGIKPSAEHIKVCECDSNMKGKKIMQNLNTYNLIILRSKIYL